jgi:uncharacterized protein YacL
MDKIDKTENEMIAPDTAPASPQQLSPRIVKPNDPKILAQNVWRIIIVVSIVLIGLLVGHSLGSSLIAEVKSPENAMTSNWFVHNYYEDLYNNNAMAAANIIGFTLIGGLLAFLLGTVVFNKILDIADSLKVTPPNEKIAIFIGLILGLLLTAMVSQITLSQKIQLQIGIPLTILLGTFLVYICLAGMISMKDAFRFINNSSAASKEDGGEMTEDRLKIFDTNVIIDGRIADVCRTGFIEGTIYIPGFVLDELQHIADSADSLKRARGRRGLDILNQMRSELPLVVRTLDSKVDFTGIGEVDAKLVRMAKKLGGVLVTNDFNLNKVAELQGATVFNINELANALKPVVLPGEEMRVTVIKEGKEQNQGVAYLDDGTMIVI